MNKFITCFSILVLQSLAFYANAQTIVPIISPRIVGGVTSEPSQWPSMVSIKERGGDKRHFCGATLIAPEWVLTAAHCVSNQNGEILSPNQIVATIGEYDLDSNPTTQPSTIIEIISHPNYNSVTLINDIALLKLSTPVNSEVMTILDIDSTLTYMSENYPVTILGWGSTEIYDPTQPTLPSYPSILQQVELQLLTDQQCENYLGSNYTLTMLCAGSLTEEKDSCSGDSGGPMLVETNLGWQQLGIVSWGYGCAYENLPGAYTRIAIYNDWIRSITSGFSVALDKNFYVESVGASDNHQVVVSNNSDFNGNFTYQITGSEYFSYDATPCMTIDANASCQFNLIYNPLEYGQQTGVFTVNSDILDTIAINNKLTGILASESDSGGGSSGSMGILILFFTPIVFIRRYMK